MPYTAVTLDTNIIVQLGYNFEAGALSQLFQFKDSPIKIVMSDVVLGEILSQLRDLSRAEWAKLEKALGRCHFHSVINSDMASAISNILDAAADPHDAAMDRIDTFLERCGAIIIEPDGATTADLVRMYFNGTPPFEPNEKKKYEFPDAISLLSLEAWAKDTQNHLLCVSSDKGWKEFSSASEYLDVCDNLASAMELLQNDIDQARDIMSYFLLQMYRASDLGQFELFLKDIEDGLNSRISARAQTEYKYEYDSLNVSLNNLELPEHDVLKQRLTIVRHDKAAIVAILTLNISILAECSFILFNLDHDSASEEIVATRNVKIDEYCSIDVLITLEGDGDVHYRPFLENVEIVRAPTWIDFGWIEAHSQ